jgi:hypothetical protein
MVPGVFRHFRICGWFYVASTSDLIQLPERLDGYVLPTGRCVFLSVETFNTGERIQ